MAAAALFRIVIPARYASTRLPAKPLADIGGKPMIVRVLERVQGAGALETWVATDHAEVRDAVVAAGGAVVMTRADHPSGTDRLAEVATLRGWADADIVVNVQGDEPLIDPAILAAVAEVPVGVLGLPRGSPGRGHADRAALRLLNSSSSS